MKEDAKTIFRECLPEIFLYKNPTRKSAPVEEGASEARILTQTEIEDERRRRWNTLIQSAEMQ